MTQDHIAKLGSQRILTKKVSLLLSLRQGTVEGKQTRQPETFNNDEGNYEVGEIPAIIQVEIKLKKRPVDQCAQYRRRRRFV